MLGEKNKMLNYRMRTKAPAFLPISSWHEWLLPMVLVAGTVMFFASKMVLLATGICVCLFFLAIASVIDHAFGIR
jgi:hypothetical protein